jgi:hypothetical protein
MKRPYFLNVDLDIESKTSLRSLAREFGNKVLVMFSGRIKGRHCLFVEIAGTHQSPDATIHALCGLVEGLSAVGKRAWDAAQRKEFDVGYEARHSSQRTNHFKIRQSTLRRVAKLGAGLAVTFYREERAEPTTGANAASPRRSV